MNINRMQIEAVRTELHQLADKWGLQHESVLAKSKELDHLLNRYQQQNLSPLSFMKVKSSTR